MTRRKKLAVTVSKCSWKASCRLRAAWRTFQGDDLAGGVHDGAVGGDGPADGVVGVGHVDDDHLGLLAHFLPHADELVGLHGQGAEPDVGRVDAQVLELRCGGRFVATHTHTLNNSHTG